MGNDQTTHEEDPTVLEVLRRYFDKPADENEKVETDVIRHKNPAADRFVLAAIICFLAGQFLIEFLREALSGIGAFLLLVGFFLAMFAFLREKKPAQLIVESVSEQESENEIHVRLVWLLAACIMAVVASSLYRGGSFIFPSGLLWLASIATIVAAFFQPKNFHKPDFKHIFTDMSAKPGKLIAYFLLITVVLVFQLGRLQQVPPEIISSQVEAFYTVEGISNGDSSLWFPRNVINEPLSYYWAAFLNRVTASPLSFPELKLAYALAGLVAVFYMYKFGRRLFDEKSGFVSALLLGVGFWPILQQRSVLGFGLVLPIMLPALYYLYKSLQEDDLNCLLIASVLTGLGLLTNKIFIFLVIANLLITLAYLAKKRAKIIRNTLIVRIGIGLLVGMVVTLPLIFVIAANPSGWTGSIVNRLSIANNPDAGNLVITFFTNFWSATGMINWLNRSSWVDGIANRASLDWVSGAFFLFGLCVTVFHDFFSKPRQAISLLVLFLTMLLPSVLSIAQPLENPSLSWALGAVVPVFLIAGRGLAFAVDQFATAEKESQWVKQAAFFSFFSILVIIRNYVLINTTYVTNYEASAWNATEMSEVIRNYDTGQAGTSQAYIVGFPYWVDARSVAISLGTPFTNLSILTQELSATVDLQIAKIFLLNINDTESLSQLQSLYPEGVSTNYQSFYPDKDFVIYIASQ